VQNKTELKIVLVDTHLLFRKGLKAIISDYPDFEVVGDFSTWKESIPIFQNEIVDILVIDTDFSEFSANELKTLVSKGNDYPKILALTFSNSMIQSLDVITSGVDGYLLKDEEIENLIAHLRNVCTGNFVLSEKLNNDVIGLIKEKSNFPFHFLVSEREFEVLKLVQDGLTNKEISQKLFLSENTIKTHLKHIYKKFSVKSRRDAIQKAKMWGFFR